MTKDGDFIRWKLLAPLDVERAAINMELALYINDASERTIETRKYIDELRMQIAKGAIKANPDKKRQYGMLISKKVANCAARFVFPKSTTESKSEFPLVEKAWHEKHGCLVDQDARVQMTEGNFKMRSLPVRAYDGLGSNKPSVREQCDLSSEEEVKRLGSFLSKNYPGRHLCSAKESR